MLLAGIAKVGDRLIARCWRLLKRNAKAALVFKLK